MLINLQEPTQAYGAKDAINMICDDLRERARQLEESAKNKNHTQAEKNALLVAARVCLVAALDYETAISSIG